MQVRCAGVQQLAQRHDGSLSPVQFALETQQVAGDELGPPLRVAGGQDRLDLGQRNIEIAQPADHLRRRDLLGRIVAVPS